MFVTTVIHFIHAKGVICVVMDATTVVAQASIASIDFKSNLEIYCRYKSMSKSKNKNVSC